MILVINLNASVDKRYTLPELTKGKVKGLVVSHEVQRRPSG